MYQLLNIIFNVYVSKGKERNEKQVNGRGKKNQNQMPAHPNPPPQKINKQYNTKQQNQNKINNTLSKALGIP